jgi:CDP-glucose 4,6-dehydratase
LVTGADGFLGANLVKLLLDEGHDVTGTALNRKGFTSLDALGVKCRIEYGDITEPAFIERVLNATEAQWVFHLAAVSIVRQAAANPRRCYETNIMGTVNVLEACSRAPGIDAVVVASSDKAYGDNGGALYAETDELRPKGIYEVSKACCDLITRSYSSRMNTIVTRCGNLFGPGDLNWSRLVPNSIRLAYQGYPPQIYGAANACQREWVYVKDACRAYLLLAQKGRCGEAYNVGSGWVSTASNIAYIISNVFQSPEPVMIDPLACGEIPAQALDSSKLRRMGWEPQNDMHIMLTDTCRWYTHYLRWPL